MGDSAHRDLNPKCEDYYSEEDSDQGVVLDDADRASPAPAANVAAKRSQPGMDKVLPSDLQSDSGYSSHTAATMSSADSAPSARSPPAASTTATTAPMPPPSPAATATRRRQTLEKLARDAEKGVASDRQHSGHSQKSSQSSPRNKPLQRAPSTASKRPSAARRPSTVDRETDDQNALAFRTRRPQASVVPSVVHSEPTPSTVYTSLSSPTYSRQPAPYAHGPTVVQPAHSRRRSSSTAPAPRRAPTYYQDPGHGYYPQGAMPGSYTSTPDHGLPLSLARYPNMSPHSQMHPQIHQPQHHQVQHPQMPSYMMPPGMQPGSPYYPNGQPMAHQASQPYDQRPSMSARNPSGPQYQTRRPESGYGTAQIIQPNKTEKMPSARYPNVPQPTRRPDPREEEESDSSESEEYCSEEEPPPRRKPREILPPPPKMKDARPPLQKANTTTIINEVRNRRRGSVSHQQPERRREPRDAQVPSATVRTRAPSVGRPTTLVQQHKAVSYPRGDKDNVVVDHSRTQRRTSYHPSYDIEYEAEPRRQRISKVFHGDYDERGDERRRNSRTPKPYHEDQYDREVVERKRSNRSSKVYPQDFQQDFQQFELEPKRRNRSSKIYHEEPEPELRRRHRDSKIYHDYDVDSIEPEPERSYRGPDASALRRDEYIDKKDRHKVSEAIAYQQRTRGSEDPLNDLVHKAALKKQSRVPSDGASSRSDDKKSRVSRAQTTMTNGGNGEIRLRVDASAPISVALNGDMNGRTLQVVPGEDGMADIVIGSSQDNETVYGGERSSVHGSHRKSIGAPPNSRRDAEEQSIRSSRSSHSRREADKRELERPSRGGGVLRRRTDFN